TPTDFRQRQNGRRRAGVAWKMRNTLGAMLHRRRSITSPATGRVRNRSANGIQTLMASSTWVTMSTNGVPTGSPRTITRLLRRETLRVPRLEPGACRGAGPGDIKSKHPVQLIEAACRRRMHTRITEYGSSAVFSLPVEPDNRDVREQCC